jgi:hypothetical protein
MIAMMIESALRALLFAIAVGAVLRLLRVSHVPVRKAAWSLVLIASLGMPGLMRVSAIAGWSSRLGWSVPVPLKQIFLPRVAVPAGPAPVVVGHFQVVNTRSQAPASFTAVAPVMAAPAAEAKASEPERARPADQADLAWPPPVRLIVLVYLTVSGALLLRLLWGLGLAMHLWITADRVSPLVAPQPNVRSSPRVLSPVTIGSGILLPADYTTWERKKLRMVLAHEWSHVRQMDFYLQLLAGLYTVFFWFSPLGWWLRRTLASLGEAIGDRAGIDAAASRSRYAEVLLEFAAMPRQTLAGVAMARPGDLSRRIDRLLNERLFNSAFSEGRRRAFLSLLLIPAALFAAIAMIRVPGASAQTAPAAAAATAPAPAPREQATPAAPPEAGQAPPAPPSAPAAPAAQAEGQASGSLPDGNTVTVQGSDSNVVVDDDSIDGYAWHFSEDGDSYAIVAGPGQKLTFSGNWSEDREDEIDAARKVANGPFLWFSHDGKSYIVTDPAIVESIRALYKPIQELGRQQGELGKQQEALGKQMQVLACAQEKAGRVQMPDLSKEMAQLDAAVARLKEAQEKWDPDQLSEVEAKLKDSQDKVLTPEEMSEVQAALSEAQAESGAERMAEMQAKLGDLQARLGELQGEAGARQGDFGAKMGALGAQQGALGAEQGRLGAEQGRLTHEADRQVRRIIQDCLHNGKAVEVPEDK